MANFQLDQLPPEHRAEALRQMQDRGPARTAVPVIQHGQPVERPKRRHKYNAKATEIDGIRFPSQKEAERYLILKARAAAGEIRKLELQPSFELQPKFTDAHGKKHRAINYVADFQYYENGHRIIEEVKGHETAVWKLKKKLFLFKYGRQVVLRIIK